MSLHIIRQDITKVKADATVNTANPHPEVGRGTDGAVYEAAGFDDLLAARKAIGDIAPGSVAVTDGFALPAKYIIHAVSPRWHDGHHGEAETLRSCYTKALEAAESLGCKSVAFPLLATGVYDYPQEAALRIGIDAISGFLMHHDMEVYLTVFSENAYNLAGMIFEGITSYIDGNAAVNLLEKEYDHFCEKARIMKNAGKPAPGSAGPTLEEVLAAQEKNFPDRLFELIDERGYDKDANFYKKAHVDRKLFSKIRSKPGYKPSKDTAIALSLALELSMPEMIDLLSRAGLALSRADRRDRLITFFVEKKNFNIDEINFALASAGEPLIGE